MRKLSKIIVHCSASEAGDAAVIDTWHRKRGWSGIGYHFVILNGQRTPGTYLLEDDGVVEQGRSLYRKGAHCKGHNADSIGICLIGQGVFSPLQWQALHTLCLDLHEKYHVCRILGHYELNPHKTCPCVNMDALRKWLGKLWSR